MSVDAWVTSQGQAIDDALRSLVEVNSFSGNRAGGNEVVARLVGLFELPGLSAQRVPSGRFADHLVLRSKGQRGEAPVALLGHSDTVFPPGTFEGYRADGGLRRGPGVFDMKGGLVSVAFALKALAGTVGLDALPPLRVVIVSDEEVGSPEGGALIRAFIGGAQACLVFEPGRGNDAIVTERQGTGSVVCRAHGTAAHSGNAYWEGVSAIRALAKFVDGAEALSDRASGTIVNVGTIAGGTSKNTVPAEATAGVDLRFQTAPDGERLVATLEAVAAKAAAAVPGARVEVERGPMRAPMNKVPGADELRRRYGRCARAAGLSDEEAPRQGGGSDGNTAAAMGIPTIDGLGPRGRGFHTHDEQVEFETVLQRTRALANFLAGFAR
ncbi:MAG: M20/M25/M40 family metallo-hydrolase [Myxococcaceae bacterium]|jgi:glutamate carboxypeptidase|nr:M20/M25/M40 family metallo-hydrolase [Myxococcaceae bacterium]MCA3015083.1 M20/M25/M40 family metallo-hydrolase [Myxococcaceae bacterium]